MNTIDLDEVVTSPRLSFAADLSLGLIHILPTTEGFKSAKNLMKKEQKKKKPVDLQPTTVAVS